MYPKNKTSLNEDLESNPRLDIVSTLNSILVKKCFFFFYKFKKGKWNCIVIDGCN